MDNKGDLILEAEGQRGRPTNSPPAKRQLGVEYGLSQWVLRDEEGNILEGFTDAELGANEWEYQKQQHAMRASKLCGVVDVLGTLPAGALITEKGLAQILGKCTASIKAAVERGELPRPVRLMGKNTWTAGTIIRHMESRIEAATRKFLRLSA